MEITSDFNGMLRAIDRERHMETFRNLLSAPITFAFAAFPGMKYRQTFLFPFLYIFLIYFDKRIIFTI